MVSSDPTVGTIVSLWRYPVKSMLGEELNATQIQAQGLLGDRAYALMETATGMTVSAKNPRKWAKMFDCRATLAAPNAADTEVDLSKVKITLPDGTIVTSDAADANGVLSQLFGRDVTLSQAPPAKPSLEEYWPTVEGLPHQDAVTAEATMANTFFDGATVHLLTTATMDHFKSITPSARFETRRFRPNLVVKTINGASGFVENDWIGRTIAIGDSVQLEVTGACPRCVMTTMAQGELGHDLSVLQTAVQHNGGNVGIYASVKQGGVVRRGDPVKVL
jgi:uncharacterized protein